ncbi:hypothetical protein CEXT_530201, partial [Caerostris extrusa]
NRGWIEGWLNEESQAGRKKHVSNKFQCSRCELYILHADRRLKSARDLFAGVGNVSPAINFAVNGSLASCLSAVWHKKRSGHICRNSCR